MNSLTGFRHAGATARLCAVPAFLQNFLRGGVRVFNARFSEDETILRGLVYLVEDAERKRGDAGGKGAEGGVWNTVQ